MTNKDRAISQAKQLRRIARKKARFEAAQAPVKLASPVYANRTGVRHVRPIFGN